MTIFTGIDYIHLVAYIRLQTDRMQVALDHLPDRKDTIMVKDQMVAVRDTMNRLANDIELLERLEREWLMILN